MRCPVRLKIYILSRRYTTIICDLINWLLSAGCDQGRIKYIGDATATSTTTKLIASSTPQLNVRNQPEDSDITALLAIIFRR